MKITGERYDLEVGTVIAHWDGLLAIASEYNDYEGGYEIHDVKRTVDGGFVDNGGVCWLIPRDFIGEEIIGKVEIKNA